MGSLFSYLNLWRFGREEVDYEELLAKTIFEATDEYEDSLLPPEERASRKERDKTITKIIYGAACLALLISMAMNYFIIFPSYETDIPSHMSSTANPDDYKGFNFGDMEAEIDEEFRRKYLTFPDDDGEGLEYKATFRS